MALACFYITKAGTYVFITLQKAWLGLSSGVSLSVMTNEPTTLETRCAPGVTSSFFGSLELSMSLAPHFVGPTEIYIYEGIDPRLAHSSDGGLAGS